MVVSADDSESICTYDYFVAPFGVPGCRYGSGVACESIRVCRALPVWRRAYERRADAFGECVDHVDESKRGARESNEVRVLDAELDGVCGRCGTAF